MNAAALLAQYERIANASDAVERLRQFVLDLAVRGKLVPQNPNERVHPDVIDMNPAQSDLPNGWRQSKVGTLLDFQYGTGLKASEREEQGPVPVYGSNGVVGYTDRALTEKPSVIIGRKGSAGALNLCNGPSWTTDVAYFVEAPSYFDLRFLFNALAALGLDKLGKGVKPGLSRADAYSLQISVPPLAEQHRIVAKVDELMVLCDRLEAARLQREATRDRLAAASLARLYTPNPETFQADARFAIGTALPALTTRPDQIKQLRQTILSLAVRGRLVGQDPGDEPAQKLLRRIEQKRNALLTAAIPNSEEARSQLLKQAEQVLPGGLSELPAGWTWATLMQCSAIIIDCRNKTAPQVPSGVRLVRTTNIRDGKLNDLDLRFVDEATYEIWSSRARPQAGDILITREAPMGEVCLIPVGARICLGQRVMLARLVPDTIDAQFMIYSLRDPFLMERVQDKPIGSTVQHLRVGGVETLLVPLPPVQEQLRIVRKLEELMALCDQLEASLTHGENTRSRLLNALLHEALAPPHDNVVDMEAARQRLREKRAAVASRIVERMSRSKGLGRVRVVKALYFAEAHCRTALGGQWGRGPFGPYDHWILSFESKAVSAGWLARTEHSTADSAAPFEYKPGPQLSAKAQAAAQALGDQTDEFERVLALLSGLNSEESEIVATLYAAWNDLLLEGKPVSDDIVITEFREHWGVPRKASFQPADLRVWLDWMRKNRLTPKGHAPSTRHQAELI